MAGESEFGPAPDTGAPQRVVTPRIPRDPIALREAVEAALARGDRPARVDATTVRPLAVEAGGGGAVPWGVRLHRDDDGLVVAPAGLLTPTSVARLREIVDTRRTLYPRIVIDLRELLDADPAGLDALVSWDADLPWDPKVAALGDPRTLDALERSGLSGALPLVAFEA